MSSLRYFFDEIVNFKIYAVIIAAVLTAILLLCAANLSLFSNLARLRRGEKALNKFFKTNSHINRYNRALFNRTVIKKLPNKPRKIWVESAVFYQDYSSEAFEAAVKNTSKHGGNSTFVAYVFSYIAALILILIGLIAVGGEDYYAALTACAVIFGGAVGLLGLAIELYYLDKHAEKKALSMISELKSRNVKKNGTTIRCGSQSDADKRRKESLLDTVQRLYSREGQITSLNNEKTDEIDAVAEKIEENRVGDCVKCLESKSADDFDALKTQHDTTEANQTEAISPASIDNSCINVDNLMEYESALSKGANAICATGVNAPVNEITAGEAEEKSKKDKIAELENLINALISENSSKSLINEAYDVISELAEYNFTSSVELARIKILLKRLKTAI